MGYGTASAQIQAYSKWTTRFTVLAQTLLARPAIYRKTPIQSRDTFTLDIRTISRRVDQTCILNIAFFIIFLPSAPGLA